MNPEDAARPAMRPDDVARARRIVAWIRRWAPDGEKGTHNNGVASELGCPEDDPGSGALEPQRDREGNPS